MEKTEASKKEPRIDGLFHPDGRAEVFCGGVAVAVVPDDGTERSGLAWAIRRLKEKLAGEEGP